MSRKLLETNEKKERETLFGSKSIASRSIISKSAVGSGIGR